MTSTIKTAAGMEIVALRMSWVTLCWLAGPGPGGRVGDPGGRVGERAGIAAEALAAGPGRASMVWTSTRAGAKSR